MSACLQASTQRKLLIISLHGLFVSKSHFETEKNVLENHKVFLLEFFVGFENLKMARLVFPPPPPPFLPLSFQHKLMLLARAAMQRISVTMTGFLMAKFFDWCSRI